MFVWFVEDLGPGQRATQPSRAGVNQDSSLPVDAGAMNRPSSNETFLRAEILKPQAYERFPQVTDL